MRTLSFRTTIQSGKLVHWLKQLISSGESTATTRCWYTAIFKFNSLHNPKLATDDPQTWPTCRLDYRSVFGFETCRRYLREISRYRPWCIGKPFPTPTLAPQTLRQLMINSAGRHTGSKHRCPYTRWWVDMTAIRATLAVSHNLELPKQPEIVVPETLVNYNWLINCCFF